MYEKLRAHIEALFENAPHTRKAEELKEELYADLSAKYADLVAQGKSEEDAFQIAISGIGDVDELLYGLKYDPYDPVEEARRKKSAGVIAAAVGIYILSMVPVIIFQNSVGAIGMFVLIAIATIMLVYNHVSQPRYFHPDDTVVDEFKKWKSNGDDTRRLYRSITAALWPLIVVLYFIISFFFRAWAYSWIIFLVGVALQNIIRLALDLRGNRHE
ncbi:MAG: permease prefix domain 1-containing protein [Ethanoligenens sp.]